MKKYSYLAFSIILLIISYINFNTKIFLLGLALGLLVGLSLGLCEGISLGLYVGLLLGLIVGLLLG